MNKEKLKGYLDKVKAALGKVSKKIWIIIAVTVAILVIGIVIFLKTRPYATLITGATNEETGTVLSWLQQNGITDYKVEGTNTILVPESQVASLKARLLQEEYSSAKSPYSGYFEQVGALSTESVRSKAWLTTLIDAYEKTIRQFPGVRDVEVTINLGEDRGYVLDVNNVVEASAGVMLHMERNKTLDEGQVNAIRNYIASGVAGLDVKNVTIEDDQGTPYDISTGNGNTAAASSALKLQIEHQMWERIRSQVIQALAPIYGEDNISVGGNVTVELGDKTVNDYQVHLPEFAEDGSTGGRGIMGKEYYIYQFITPDDGAVGGVVGTSTNSELPTYVEQGNAQAELQKILEEQVERDYDNSKTQTQMVITAATVKDVTVTVGIDSANYGVVNIDLVRSGVASAAGILVPLELPEGMTAEQYLARYITVINDRFQRAPEPVPAPTFLEMLESMGIPTWVVFAAVAGLILFAIILTTIILLVRRRKKKKQEAEQKAVEELMAAAMPGQVEIGPDGQPVVQPVLDENGHPVSGADVMELHTERSMELRQGIRDFVDENMEVAALLIKSWLKEDGDNG